MGIEIERKFLVKNSSWKEKATGNTYKQGYLSKEAGRTVRVRIAKNKGWITIKGISTGASRSEFEYEIPVMDAEELLLLCEGPLIEKVRYELQHGTHRWEIDEFMGSNQGLVVAEVELKEENETLDLPDWIDQEVTADHRYFNSQLAINPYTAWQS